MSTGRGSLALSDNARTFLFSQLRDVARASPSSLRRRSQILALTFRPRKQRRDALPDAPIPLDQFVLLALSDLLDDPYRPRSRRRPILAGCRATFDFPGSGRIIFRPQRSYDLSNPQPLTQSQPDFTAIRSAVLLHQALEDTHPREIKTQLLWPRFFFGFSPEQTPPFDPGDFPAARHAERTINGLHVWPAQFFFRNGRTTLGQRPTEIFACLNHLKGRQIRNPAFQVLKDHGLLPTAIGYQAWLKTVTTSRGRDRVVPDPRVEGTEAARLRQTIEDHFLAEPARESVLLGRLDEACQALGIRLAEAPDRIDALAQVLDHPWRPQPVPQAAAIQVVHQTGTAVPVTPPLRNELAGIDLFDRFPTRERSVLA
jgi:hypothetical protein